MFPNVHTFSITINGRELDVTRVQATVDRITNALLETEDPLGTLENIIARGLPTAPPVAPPKRPKRKAGEVLADVARGVESAVEAAAPVVSVLLSKKRGA